MILDKRMIFARCECCPFCWFWAKKYQQGRKFGIFKKAVTIASDVNKKRRRPEISSQQDGVQTDVAEARPRAVPIQGSQICEPDRVKSQCKECLGSSMCPYMYPQE